jgi:hypothetical protein
LPLRRSALQHLPAVQAGQHHVEHQQVVVAGERQVQAIDTIARQIDHEAGLRQALAQVVAGLGLVFDDQDFHVAARRAGKHHAQRHAGRDAVAQRRSATPNICWRSRCPSGASAT